LNEADKIFRVFITISKKITKAVAAGLMLIPFTSSNLYAENASHTLIVSDTSKRTRWAVVHQHPDATHNDPYYHLEVFEHKKGDKPWVFKRIAQHMVITPEALNKSRNGKKAKTYAYKDVEFWITYKHWRDTPESRARTPVCESSITDCLQQASEQK